MYYRQLLQDQSRHPSVPVSYTHLYLAKTYLETKHRPIFILKESKVQTAGKVAGDSFVGSGVNDVMREKKSGEESHEDKTVKASA